MEFIVAEATPPTEATPAITPPRPVHWIAHYTDGSELHQRAGATFRDIARDRLQAFDLWHEDGRLLVRIDMRPDSDNPQVGPKRLVCKLRRRINDRGEELFVHMAGWQRKVGEINVQSICYAFEDGTILLGGQFNERLDFQGPIIPEAWEGDLL